MIGYKYFGLKGVTLLLTFQWALIACTTDSEENKANSQVLWRDTMNANIVNFTDEYGVRHGRWIEVDHFNSIRKEMYYRSGKLDSTYLEWKDGKLIVSGHYKLGKKNGHWNHFDSKDSLSGIVTYKDGELIDSQIKKELK